MIFFSKIQNPQPNFKKISEKIRINADILMKEITEYTNKEIERIRKLNMISDFYFKKLGKMIYSQDTSGFYDLNDKYTLKLLDAGYIESMRWTESFAGFICLCHCYHVTESGRKAYENWIKK